MAATDTILEIRALTIRFHTRQGQVTAVDGLDLSVSGFVASAEDAARLRQALAEIPGLRRVDVPVAEQGGADGRRRSAAIA